MTLVATLKWMNRAAMIERGIRAYHLHTRNLCSNETLHAWYAKHVPFYACFPMRNRAKPYNRQAIESRFWRDVELAFYARYYPHMLEDSRHV